METTVEPLGYAETVGWMGPCSQGTGHEDIVMLIIPWTKYNAPSLAHFSRQIHPSGRRVGWLEEPP